MDADVAMNPKLDSTDIGFYVQIDAAQTHHWASKDWCRGPRVQAFPTGRRTNKGLAHTQAEWQARRQRRSHTPGHLQLFGKRMQDTCPRESKMDV